MNTALKRIVIGSDHAGFTLKEQLIKHVKTMGFQTLDVGTYQKSSCHYPDFAQKLANSIQKDEKGILVCGSGIGIGISGVKSGLKCSVAFNQFTAKECRRLGMQVMSLGERSVSAQIAKKMIEQFLRQQ